ncbi:hypothetical protein [Amphritea balenae]|uniref:Uncharacterized protein n=1 Tax=Amphritea balenae TaxID=452629 RepID=A0A3P1SPB3_9GAMM|nr:hypothetical protein [Amphritea balenae]RRC98495.1 hypothetical protein EHS89_12800 [Amphritea balenae]GGK64962.1 hypothetical protein GCM10007941_13860 [Amphritea balenae]
MNTPTECPKWESCSAAVCPMNRTGKHLKGETVCLYAQEMVKPWAYFRFEECGIPWVYETLLPNLGWLLDQSPDIHKRMLKASTKRTRLVAKPF